MRVSETNDPAGPSAAPPLRLAFEGALEGLGSDARRRLLARREEERPDDLDDERGDLDGERVGERSDDLAGERVGERPDADAQGDIRARVAEIVAGVRSRGDDALREMARRWDGAELTALEVPRERWSEALDGLERPVRTALERAAGNIRTFHAAQLPPTVEVEVEPGVRLVRTSVPLRRVGVYAPGGRAAYPSSVLMGVVPARCAGVEEVVVCSPPGRDGLPSREVMAAAAVAGADRLFAVGGAGAVAALAYGTRSVPAVDAVVGPGNRWVTEAKRQVARDVVIDAPAGPSEILIVAEGGATSAEEVVTEMMAQAEHDPEACAVVVTTSPRLAAEILDALPSSVEESARATVIREALERRGAVLTAADLEAALAFAEAYAPEHLSVQTRDPERDAERVPSAGTVFLGRSSSVAFGDYLTGANHVLPTGGAARIRSGLSTLTFLRFVTWQEVTPGAAARLAGPTAALAGAEGLPAHAAAALLRSGRSTP